MAESGWTRDLWGCHGISGWTDQQPTIVFSCSNLNNNLIRLEFSLLIILEQAEYHRILFSVLIVKTAYTVPSSRLSRV